LNWGFAPAHQTNEIPITVEVASVRKATHPTSALVEARPINAVGNHEYRFCVDVEILRLWPVKVPTLNYASLAKYQV
jgi:hypothetical protein